MAAGGSQDRSFAEPPRASARHLSEQYLTCSQVLAQRLRQTIGRPQQAQVLTGRSAFLTPRGMSEIQRQLRRGAR